MNGQSRRRADWFPPRVSPFFFSSLPDEMIAVYGQSVGGLTARDLPGVLVCTAASLDPRGEKRKKREKSFFEKTGSTGFVGSALPRVSRSLGFKRAIEETILHCNQCPMIKRGGNVVQQKITTCCSTVQTVFDDEFFF